MVRGTTPSHLTENTTTETGSEVDIRSMTSQVSFVVKQLSDTIDEANKVVSAIK